MSATSPSIEAARAMGEKGGPAVETERLAFEAWMQGHCWVVGGEWDGTTYRNSAETGAFIDAQTMLTRQLWAAWRDRAALSVVDDSKTNTNTADFDSPERTGVGDWCAPGPAADQKQQWLLWYEDRDKGYQLYENETEARVAFARSETMGWNCHLFQHAPRTKQEGGTFDEAFSRGRAAEKADWLKECAMEDDVDTVVRRMGYAKTW